MVNAGASAQFHSLIGFSAMPLPDRFKTHAGTYVRAGLIYPREPCPLELCEQGAPVRCGRGFCLWGRAAPARRPGARRLDTQLAHLRSESEAANERARERSDNRRSDVRSPPTQPPKPRGSPCVYRGACRGGRSTREPASSSSSILGTPFAPRSWPYGWVEYFPRRVMREWARAMNFPCGVPLPSGNAS
jgi:hypothetical protein